MPRQAGSKNKPKSAKDLLDKVIVEYAKQGKKLSVNLADINNLTDEQKVLTAQALADNPDLNVPNIFELESEDDEGEDSFTCGNCKAELDGEDSQCPHCGMPLSW